MKTINKQETKELIESSRLKKRDDLKHAQWDSASYYQLETGQILIDVPGVKHSHLLDDEDEYFEKFGHLKKSKPKFILNGFPDSQVGYLQLVTQCQKKLAKILNTDELEFSFAGLKKLDGILKDLKISLQFYNETLFNWIVPFVTETIIKECNGRLVMNFNLKANVIEPCIILPDAREINVFIDLSEEANEDFTTFSIYSTSQLRLQSF
ncbi:MAG: hypothetical protein ABI480_03725 [Chitinophagaceae bacterium]